MFCHFYPPGPAPRVHRLIDRDTQASHVNTTRYREDGDTGNTKVAKDYKCKRGRSNFLSGLSKKSFPISKAVELIKLHIYVSVTPTR